MKRFFALLTACVLAVAAYAQTAEEIVARMDAAMEQVSAENGFRMTMDLKIPILGTMSSDAWSLGDKMRLEANMMGKKLVTWQDGQTEWTYDSSENTITIENQDKTKKSDEKENMKMFQSATEGYDVSIAKETAESWTIKCKKNRFNTNKDDPKNMEIVIAKDTYYRHREGHLLSDEPERQGGPGHRHDAQPQVQRDRGGSDFQQGRLSRRHHHRQAIEPWAGEF